MAEVTSSSLVGPTILFRYLADFLRLLVLHLCHSCASEEESWPPLLREMAGGLPESESVLAGAAVGSIIGFGAGAYKSFDEGNDELRY